MVKTSSGASWVAALVVGSFGAPAFAQTYLDEDVATTRMLALGGRAEAVGSGSAAMFGNPAVLTATRSYQTDAFGLWDPTTNRFSVGSAVVDSTRQTISAGFSYVYSTVTNAVENYNSNDARINLSLAISTALGVGVNIRYLNTNGAPPAVNPQGALLSQAYQGLTIDAGVFARPAQFLQLSVSGRNLNDQSNTNTPIGMGIGVAVIPFASLTIVGDALLDFRSTASVRGRYSGGIEYLIAGHVPLRAGYVFDDVRGTQAFTAGLGYLDTNIGIDVSLRQGFEPQMQTTLMVSLRYFYTGAL